MNNTKIRKKLKKNKIIYAIYQPYKKIKNAIKTKNRRKKLFKNGYQLLNDVNVLLNKNNIKAFCAYGTLLGFIRDGGIIAHDLDLDMGVIKDKNFSWDVLDSLLSNIDLKVKHYFKYNGEITEKTYIRNGVTIDFFRYEIDKNEMHGYIYFKDEKIDYKSENDHSIKVSRVPIINSVYLKNINGTNVLIPNNSVEYLEKVYGKGWKIPDPNFKHEEEIIENKYSEFYEA